jgi:ankyrin repeat protein
LVVAANLGFVEGMELLITGGARVDEPNSTGETPLISAVHRRDIAMVRVLLKAGASPDRADSSGRTARDYAKLERNDNIVDEINNAKKSGGKAAAYGPSF